MSVDFKKMLIAKKHAQNIIGFSIHVDGLSLPANEGNLRAFVNHIELEIYRAIKDFLKENENWEQNRAFILAQEKLIREHNAIVKELKDSLKLACEIIDLTLRSGCGNSGMYGQLGISPGECASSKHACCDCKARKLKAKLVERGHWEGKTK